MLRAGSYQEDPEQRMEEPKNMPARVRMPQDAIAVVFPGILPWLIGCLHKAPNVEALIPTIRLWRDILL